MRRGIVERKEPSYEVEDEDDEAAAELVSLVLVLVLRTVSILCFEFPERRIQSRGYAARRLGNKLYVRQMPSNGRGWKKRKSSYVEDDDGAAELWLVLYDEEVRILYFLGTRWCVPCNGPNGRARKSCKVRRAQSEGQDLMESRFLR